MKYTVYQTTNLFDGKIYIGKHICNCKECKYMGSGLLLKRAINKDGIKNFKKEVLYQFDTEAAMDAKEAELVNEEFVNFGNTYNLCLGGKGGFGYINNSDIRTTFANRPEKQKELGARGNEKFCLLLEEEKFAKEFAEKVKRGLRFAYDVDGISNGFAGKKHTEQTKQKIRDSKRQVGTKNSQFGTMWITNGTENRKIKKDLDSIPEGWYKGRR